MLAPVAAVGALTAAGFTQAGIAGGETLALGGDWTLIYGLGSIAATIQSIVYGGATGGAFSLLQSAGATMVLPSIGAIFTGTVATGAGIAVMKGETVATNDILTNSSTRAHRPDGPGGDDDEDSDPPPYQVGPEEYLLTPPAVKAIVRSWIIAPYNPPGTNLGGWLSKVHKLCEQYEIPTTQRALCSMHHMRTDCREAAHAAECYDMTWDQFTAWLSKYDGMCYFDIPVFATKRLPHPLDMKRTRLNSEIGSAPHTKKVC